GDGRRYREDPEQLEEHRTSRGHRKIREDEERVPDEDAVGGDGDPSALHTRREAIGEVSSEQHAGYAPEDDQRADHAGRLLLGHSREALVELRQPGAYPRDREHQCAYTDERVTQRRDLQDRAEVVAQTANHVTHE